MQQATGTMGIQGDLCSDEMLQKLVHVARILTQERHDFERQQQEMIM